MANPVLVPSVRNTEAPVIDLVAATEKQVDITFPADVEAMELWLYPIPTDVRIARNAGVATTEKTPVPAAGFPIRFRRKTDEVGAVIIPIYLVSTTGGKVPSWTR